MEIEALIAGEGTDEEQARRAGHIDACPACRNVASELTSAPTLTARCQDGRDTPAPADKVTSDLIPGHELLELRGRGGQAMVWKALQLATRRIVAVKLYPPSTVGSARGRVRFEREAELLGRLRHPGIVTVHDAGISNGWPFLVTEWVEGKPIDETPRERGLTLEQTLPLFAAACRAVHAAHQRQVLHLDLKPSNVLVDAQGPRVLDFGVSRILGRTREGERGFAGTPSRAAPEQLAGEDDLDVRTDVYALGVMLRQLATGVRSGADTKGQRGKSATKGGAGSWSSSTSALGADLSAIVAMATHPQRERRHPSAEDLARDVENCLTGRPLLALSHDRWHVVRRTAWSHRWWIAAAAGVMLATSLGMLAVVRSARRAERERDLALEAERRAERSAETARRTAELLMATFEAASPMDTDGASVTARDVLDAGRRRLAGESDLDATIRAELWRTMGRAYEGIGLFLGAEETLQIALDSAGAELLLGDDDAARIAADLSRVQRARGDYDGAARTHGTALDALRQAGRTNGRGFAHLLLEQASWHVDKARAHEALPLARRGLSILARVVGADHPESAEARNVLGLALLGVDRPADAAEEFRRASAALSVSGVRWAGGAATSQANLALALSGAGKVAEATQEHERALAQFASMLGPEHPRTLQAASDFAGHLYSANQHERAVELLGDVLDVQRRVLGPRHPRTATTCGNLAVNLLELRRLDEAESLMREELSIVEEVFGPESAQAAMAIANLGSVYQRRSQHDESIRLLRRAADIQRSQPAGSGAALLETLGVLGVAYFYVGDLVAAESVLRECANVGRLVYGPDHPSLANTLHNLAAIVRRLGKLEEALDLQLEALAIARRALPPEHYLVSFTNHNLGLIELARGDVAAARDALEVALRLRERTRGPGSPEAHESLIALCRVLEAAGRTEELAAAAGYALSLGERLPTPPQDKNAELQSLLGHASLRRNRAEALALLCAGSETLLATSGASDPRSQAALARFEQARTSRIAVR